jgi:hypothetical protein
MNAKELIRFAFGSAIKDTPAGPVLLSTNSTVAPPSEAELDDWRRAAARDDTRFDGYAMRSVFELLDDARRRIRNQAESLKCPRLEDVVEIQRLKGELARTRFLSVLRGKLGETWARMLDKERAELARVKAELAEANNRWHSACDVGRRLEVRNAQLTGELAELTAAIP